VIETFAVAPDRFASPTPVALGRALVAEPAATQCRTPDLIQVAPILPYLLLVLILIFSRPKGLLGTREG
jgi:branched-chain amino acid transport system permease protein